VSHPHSILIVDDEPLARARLRELLGDAGDSVPHFVVGECGSATEALEAIHRLAPDIVLLDVQMPGMTGIELARHISALAASGERRMPVVVFVTAHDEFALEAFEVDAVDYLLKPVRGARLVEALRRALARLPSDRIRIIDDLARNTETHRRHLPVHERGRVSLIPIEDVLYLKAELKYVTVRTAEREHLIEEALSALEEEFGDRFVRIHRNALVARDAIAGFERVMPEEEGEPSDPYWQVVFRQVPERLPISRRQWSSVKHLAG
jgi:two-component system response regulator AlgR